MRRIEDMRRSSRLNALAITLLWLLAVGAGCTNSDLSTGEGEGDDECGECHGTPPAAPHPVATDCRACHAGTILADGKLDTAGGLHGNGTADTEYTGCDVCHGAPPAAPHPEGDDCSACHPGTVLADGTIDHAGGKHANGTVDAEISSCDACHGNPPAPPHPAETDCSTCHGKTVLADGSIDIEGGFHQNGAVDVSSPHPEGYTAPDAHGADFNAGGPAACTDCHGTDLTGGTSGLSCETCHASFRTNCTFCHGGTDNDTGAPPESVTGETATDLPGVGAHSAHLLADPTWHKAFQCSDCHTVPTDALDEGHIDGTIQHVWGAMAKKDGAAPAFADGSCSGVYCHGATMEAGTVTAPSWTTVDGSQAACGACHGLPPTGAHPAMEDCSVCHGCVSDENQMIRPEGAAFHINGTVNMQGEGDCPAE